MLPRTLEPEVMDTADEAADYDSMDHSAVHRALAEDFVAALIRGETPHVSTLTVLDVGMRTALITTELLRHVHTLGDRQSAWGRGQQTGHNVSNDVLDV